MVARGWCWFPEWEAPGKGPRCASHSAVSRVWGQWPSPPRMSSCLSHLSHTGSTRWWIPGLGPPWTWRIAQSQLQSVLQVCCSKLVSNLTYFISPLGTDSQGKEMRLGSKSRDEGSESSAFGERCWRPGNFLEQVWGSLAIQAIAKQLLPNLTKAKKLNSASSEGLRSPQRALPSRCTVVILLVYVVFDPDELKQPWISPKQRPSSVHVLMFSH